MGNGGSKLSKDNRKNRYTTQKGATEGATSQQDPSYTYTKPQIDTDAQTVSIQGTKSTPGRIIDTYKNKMTAEKWKEYLKNETPEQKIKRHAREVRDGKREKPTTQTHDIKTQWSTDIDFNINPEKEPGVDFTPKVDPGGHTDEDITNNPINTKAGKMDEFLKGKGEIDTFREEESTELTDEGFGSTDTDLKTRGIANKDWGLA